MNICKFINLNVSCSLQEVRQNINCKQNLSQLRTIKMRLKQQEYHYVRSKVLEESKKRRNFPVFEEY